jgi:5-methylcytosine-specific restriction enzyme subunit McrC
MKNKLLIEIGEWESSTPIPISSFSDADYGVLHQQAEKTHFFELAYHRSTVSFKANQRVGQCVLALPDFGEIQLLISPKVPVSALMDWWCWSEGLITLSPTLIPLNSIADMMDQLACWLSEYCIQQAKKGLISAYQRKTQPLSKPKGRLLMRQSALAIARGQVSLHCQYEERSQDIPENQIIFWTLDCLRRYPLKHLQARKALQQAYRCLQGNISLIPYTAQDCVKWPYTQLNQHYQPLHRLCGMILAQISIQASSGTHPVPCFILPMNQLFERAVAQALKHQLSPNLQVVSQEPHVFSTRPVVRTLMDLVIRNTITDEPQMVLDTKYKHGYQPSNGDVYQMISYATALGVNQAILLYPHSLPELLSCQFGPVNCQSFSVAMNQPVLDAIQPLCEFINI